MRPTRLRGARTHNLKGIDLDLQPGQLVAVAGPSGAGKSSLAFGTLYAEGQRRFVESFSTYARQFLERLARPDVDELDPVPAGIAVARQAPVKTSRSTVGTMTELTDYAKVLWAKRSTLQCPGCEKEIRADHPQDVARALLAAAKDARAAVCFERAVKDDEDALAVREDLVAAGYRRVLRFEGERVSAVDLDEVPPSEAVARGAFVVVADRLVLRDDERARLLESLEIAFKRGGGRAWVYVFSTPNEAEAHAYSSRLHCACCDRDFRSPVPGMFSFNSPLGACESCRGFGRVIGVDWDKVLPDRSLSLKGGAVRCWTGKSAAMERRELIKAAKAVGIDVDKPIASFSETDLSWLIDGDEKGYPKGWYGVAGWFKWLETRAYKMHVRVFLSRYRSYDTCGACAGTRLAPESLYYRVDGMTLPAFYALDASTALQKVRAWAEQGADDPALATVLTQCEGRLALLESVGLGYLSMDRASRTLSGGEAQRVALTSALGATLSGAMFVLDEPSVGLHPSDVAQLSKVVSRLVARDNLGVVVEHHPTLLWQSDRVIELGPSAGEAGGQVVFDGTPADLAKADTATAHVLAGQSHRGEAWRSRGRVRPKKHSAWIALKGATGNNLHTDVAVPIGALTTVTGVSGSGKSSLILDTMVPAVAAVVGENAGRPLPFDSLEGAGGFSSVLRVDQSPLSRTSRGNVATYMKIWDVVRKKLCATELAKERAYTPGYFSFNVAGGRCEACKGEGAETVEMQFLADVSFSCPTCQGRRFVGPVLDVRFLGLTVADWLEQTVDTAAEVAKDEKDLAAALAMLQQVGLGYLRLGQPLNTLSGGEAQRLRLAQTLQASEKGALIVLDEPSAGLHDVDIAPLLNVMQALVDRGDTLIVVEHHMGVAAASDYIVDLGPGSGPLGGKVQASGTPAEVAKTKTRTAPYLAAALAAAKGEVAPGAPVYEIETRGAEHAMAAEARTEYGDQGIVVRGAREHNLKNVEVRLPRGELVVVTGPSGSGKSSLTFDVLHGEGQRRYLETLSPYARQFLPQMPRPAVDEVLGVPPTVSLEQRLSRGAVNSTVATVTEIAHYLRLLYATVGVPHCPDCDVPIVATSPERLAQELREGKDKEVTVLASVVRGRKGLHKGVFDKARKAGIREAYVDGERVTIKAGMSLDRYREHDVDLVLATVKTKSADLEGYLREALQEGDGTARLLRGGELSWISEKRRCPKCKLSFPELDPRLFSFNTKQGGCETCEGRGRVEIIEKQGRRKPKKVVGSETCPDCHGHRLSKLARAVRVKDESLVDWMSRSVAEARECAHALHFEGRDEALAQAPLGEFARRLEFLDRVGLGYLGLGRSADTLSGGELQRVRLSAQLGSGLTGILYVLDEPTIGLHPRDTGKLLTAMRGLVEHGNTVVVVDHDSDVIRAADHLVDMGPTGGHGGGYVLAQGPAKAVLSSEASVTAAALRAPMHKPERRCMKDVPHIELLGARAHNLKDVALRVPVGRLTVVSGVSGSGKSTLVRKVFLPALREALDLVTEPPLDFDSLNGAELIKRVVEIDQTPIGRTPRSVPATYIGIWDLVRKLLAGTPEARTRGFGPSRFSFNAKDGRCPTCEGQGARTVEMNFLPDVQVPCDDCGGQRFTDQTLSVTYHGLNVGELLQLEAKEAVEVFGAVSKIRTPLELLNELGLGYLTLGQSSNTLSGGEAQRIKLVAELGMRKASDTLYVMDEPTTGLHRSDVTRLVQVIQKLVDRGDTVVVIEHHPDVIYAADHVIDLGPEAGREGGEIVCVGTPEEIMKKRASHTGRALRDELGA